MKTAKKVCSILLAVLMAVIMIVPSLGAVEDHKNVGVPATGYASYDKGKVTMSDKEYIDSLTYDQIAGIILDWVDGKIAAVSEGFADLNEKLSIVGMEVPDSIDDIVAYKGYIAQLGGDFAKLDTSALKTRADGDINFIFSVIEFMAANSDIFGKVFSWNYNESGEPEYKEGVNFDFGKVGEFIKNPENNVDEAIVDFYDNYLIGNDIQKWFVSVVADEMNYEIKDGETFDDVINNGIKSFIADLFKKLGLLSDDGIENLMKDSNFNLRTTDVYTLIKNFVSLLQNDNKTAIDTYFRYLADNVLRPLMKIAFGCVPTGGTKKNDIALVNEFKGAYTDLKMLNTLSGGKVYYQAADGKYYVFTISATDVLSVNELTWEEGFLNFEPPTVSIGDKNTVVGTYTPTNPDPASYNPTVYTTYASYIPQEIITTAGQFGANVTAEALPEEITALIAKGNGTKMQDEFKMTVGEPVNQSLEIEFSDVEEMAEALALPAAQVAADGVSSAFGKTVTINSVDIILNYTGYSDEDTFVCQVGADVDFDADFSSLGFLASAAEAAAKAAAKAVIQNPVATIVVDNLNGSADGLDNVMKLLNFVDTDFVVDTGLFDFAGNYDSYKGVVGQANRLLCDTLKMVLSEDGYTSLGLTEGDNDNFTDNIQKLCDTIGETFDFVKQFMDEANFAEFTSGLSDVFVSSHGFNAGMIYNLDFSSVENLYVCGIRLGFDMLVKDSSPLYAIHEIVENLETLDAMFVGILEAVLNEAVKAANDNLEGFSYNFVPKTEEELKAIVNAKDATMTDLVDLVYYVATWAVPVANDLANDIIKTIGDEIGMTNLPTVDFVLGVEKGENREATLTNLVDRFCELADGLLLVIDTDADVYENLTAIATDFLPLGSMLSNAGKNGANGAFDVKYLMDVFFNDCLDGDLDSFLKLFEVKEDKIAGNVPVTKALINASEHMVDAVFPDTVKSEEYTANETVQEYFTSSENDAFIASCNMKSINAGKENYFAAIFDLIRESGILPFFTACANHDFGEEVPEVAATCNSTGTEAYKVCKNCGYKEGGKTIAVDPDNHAGGTENITAVSATCTKAGTTAGVKCLGCGKTISGCETVKALDHDMKPVNKVEPTCVKEGYTEYKCSRCTETEIKDKVPATGNHVDNDGDEKCDTCGKSLAEKKSFFEKIADFFRSIFDWFKNLFK